jgi:hypothetical protein
MGSELKRVPIDFYWPIGKIWKGYVNPYNSSECKFCGGTGYNPATKQINDTWYNWRYQLTDIETKALLEHSRLSILTHDQTSTGHWKEKEPKYIPTAEEVNEWYKSYPLGHDIVDRWICVEARAKHLGVYAACEHCIEGQIWKSGELKKLHDEWQPDDPPTGDGYQLWDTVTEGPITPVFLTLDQLCGYCEKEGVHYLNIK